MEENSLRTSRKARFIGGNSGPRGFWYLNANSIPSLIHNTRDRERGKHRKKQKKQRQKIRIIKTRKIIKKKTSDSK